MAAHPTRIPLALVSLLALFATACGSDSAEQINASENPGQTTRAEAQADVSTSSADDDEREVTPGARRTPTTERATTTTAYRGANIFATDEDWSLDGSTSAAAALDATTSSSSSSSSSETTTEPTTSSSADAETTLTTPVPETTTTTVAATGSNSGPAAGGGTSSPAFAVSKDLTYTGPVEVATVTAATIYAYSTPPAAPTPGLAEWAFASRTQFGSPQVLLVTENTGGDWLKVSLPTRPNGTEGYVHRADVSLASNPYRAVVDISDRSVTVLKAESVVAQTKAVLGKSATPTPTGDFFINELLRRPNPSGAYGPYILGLSARSEALDTFNGGEALIAVHGTNKPWLVGSNASNGCIRIPNDIITQLAGEVPLGTPISIVA